MGHSRDWGHSGPRRRVLGGAGWDGDKQGLISVPRGPQMLGCTHCHRAWLQWDGPIRGRAMLQSPTASPGVSPARSGDITTLNPA